ncbi:MAG: hypothetical protein H6682_00290 [Candidatus Eisenbacteria bacterium]|nr:hypothetical protein [Candidatus Eisenbacteria bacterium]
MMQDSVRFRFPGLIALGLVPMLWMGGAGCSSDSHPSTPPDEEPITTAMYVCSSWDPGQPTGTSVLLDAFWGTRDPEDPDIGPAPEFLGLVESLGGEVVHAYNLSMARIRIDPSVVPELDVNWAITVEEPALYPVDVFVGYDRDMDASEVVDLLESVGGTNIEPLTVLAGWIKATVPDESIPVVRASEGIRAVAGNGLACADE